MDIHSNATRIVTTLGVASLFVVVLFTINSYRNDRDGHGQARKEALIEAWINIFYGFSINYVINLLLLPLVGATMTAGNNFWLGWIYTAVSLIRQYSIRRYMQARIHKIVIFISHIGVKHS